ALLLAACTPKVAFVRIPKGEFLMGEPGSQHRVTISKAFEMSATEVTQRQWQEVMGTNPSAFPNPDAPVEQVTWNEVQEFLRRTKTRLPTEAEWEYACRAGTRTAYHTGDALPPDAANYDRQSTTPVASFPPNAWGLYDMHGNVWEWCADEYCPYPKDAVRDPFQRCGSPYKVIRGGSWHFGPDSARSALRYTHEPHLRGFSIGFRVIRSRSAATPVAALVPERRLSPPHS
ncbi:MAG TPA: formylglycine-generating enzyme family protein, partial [Thermoanaerobaculia bacterium]